MPVSTSRPPIVFSTSFQVALEMGDEGRAGLDREGGEQERNAEPGRIDREQHRALGDRLLRRRHGEDRGEDRPDAGRPAEREGEPHGIGAPQPDRPRHRGALLEHQEGEAGEPEKVQPHDDDGDAGDDAEFARTHLHQPPIALALAPNATKTVENPATNSSAANTVSARTMGSGSASASRSSEVPAR